MTNRTRVFGGTLLAVAIAATGCGGSGNGGATQSPSSAGTTSAPPTSAAASSPAPAVPTSPPAASGSGACALVTREEAAGVLGKPVPAGTSSTATIPIGGVGPVEAQYCSYGSDVFLASFDLGSAGSTIFGQYRQSLSSESDYQEVSGVGDEAFFAKGQLALRQGDTGLIVDVGQNTGSVPGEQEKEKSLAAAALARL